jgi:hypothetical protein
LFNCFILLGACIRNFICFGAQSLLLFVMLIMFGIIMYAYTARYNRQGSREC